MLLLLLSLAAVVSQSACIRARGFELMLKLEDSDCTHTAGATRPIQRNDEDRLAQTKRLYSFMYTCCKQHVQQAMLDNTQ